MRLSKIKLAGFKSFVDPTTIPFPSNLVGVVGPNGCGKSNVIDAVRWVMGESSASRLRGDSITDVIFNGSASRKPVGTASVELLFDNSETTLEGQYAKYAEISIRREVSRDGISGYFLNGTKCRRKDITGIFLGTGLGPRSYSIIEQGMISRLIEAKPEETRAFIEEAAGISKYKERRRETYNRIKRTKENLDRLLDVQEEVEKQIKHLDRQAKTAERYGRLKDDERLTAAELLALRLRELDERAGLLKKGLAEKETALEAIIAEQRRLEAAIEEARVRQSKRTDAFNEVQGRFYKSGSEIARLEQSIEHANELRERQRKDLQQAAQGAKEIADHIDKDESEIAQLEMSLSELVPGLEQARDSEQSSNDSLRRAEQALAEWQQQWDDYTQRTNTVEQTRNIEQTRAEQIESRIASLTERRKKLEAAKSAENPDELKHKFERIAVSELRTRQARDEFDRHLKDISEKIRKLRGQDEKLNRLVDERRTTLQEAEAKYASLHAVQQAAMGQANEAVKGWLEACGMENNERVVQALDVEDGWERAVETVLGDYLQAVCTSDIEEATASLAKLPKGNITLLVNQSPPESGDPESASLAGKVRKAPAAVLEMLRSVRVADSLDKAVAIRAQIGDAGSVITTDGVWLSNDWLRVMRDKDAKSGVLGREHDMRRLKTEIREFRVRCESAKKLVKDGRARLIQLEQRRETLQHDAAALLNEYSDMKASLDAARYQMDQANARQAAISEEHGDIEREEFAAQEQVRVSRLQFSSAVESLTEFEQQRESLESQREELRAEIERVREQAHQDRQSAQDMAIQFETRRSSKDSAAQNLERMQSQLTQFRDRESEISRQLEQSEEPLDDNKRSLASQLDVRVLLETELGESRRRVEQVEHDLRDLDQTRMHVDQQATEARSGVGDARMALQEVKVRREGFSDQLGTTDFELAPLETGINICKCFPESRSCFTINLANRVFQGFQRCIQVQKLRIKVFLAFRLLFKLVDSRQVDRTETLNSAFDFRQLLDLNTALETLENAIRKIDRETRTRFRETFANINTGFKRLFPKLFGGGHAYLEMTGDDLLSAGVTVMAQPPGKRNSTIHLLSGGEKALAAVALVFAIFELNPAPFCMLDEVDAPLDDANVARFCNIVREMSDRVQFVFITHNKVTMELSRQLSGVTMQEPGVSRLVSVDLDEAVQLAAS